MATLNLQIAAGSDDAYENTGTVTTGDLQSGIVDSSAEWIGLRFQNVTIPAGSTISAAVLSVKPTDSGNDEPLMDIWGVAQSNPGTFSTGTNDISGRSRTTATVNWDNADLGSDGTQFFSAPDLASIITEIIGLPGWASGNALALVMRGTNTTRDLRIFMFETAQADAAKLDITYTPPAVTMSGAVMTATALLLAAAMTGAGAGAARQRTGVGVGIGL